MSDLRIKSHPILSSRSEDEFEFTFNGAAISTRSGEMIATALFASGITVFGHHHKDNGPQGIFCANGQCSQCTVLVNDVAAKSCMVAAKPGMNVKSAEGHPPLPYDNTVKKHSRPNDIKVPVLILGGGPAGLSAAVELGKLGVDVLVVDDKSELGGKLTLQTHGFFGSVEDCWAGTRGVDIGTILSDQVAELPNISIWKESTAVGLFWDGKVGVSTPDGYKLITPERTLIAMGAREKALTFPGGDLPGVYGAGAFQTLVNRDLVKASEKLFILGGGNVGLIGGYHALQAGIDVVGLVEGLPQCGGYKVHADKLKRLGVPIWTSHTVIKAWGENKLEKVTIAKVDSHFQPIAGTEKTFEADTLLIAVGLSPVDEILQKAREYDIKVYAAGDSEEVAEASAAIFSGRIVGRKIAQDIGIPVDIPDHWDSLAETLRSKPGEVEAWKAPKGGEKIYPVIRCVQEIPCNPCSAACPENLIKMEGIMGIPEYTEGCLGCGNCVSQCPGLAINLVCEDYDPSGDKALLMLPFEFGDDQIPLGHNVSTVDFDGIEIGQGKVIAVRERPDQDRRRLLMVEVPFNDRHKVAGFSIRKPSIAIDATIPAEEADPIVCRCERVRKSEIVREIRAGVRDINQLKALARPSMGGCGGKTCTDLVMRVFREEGITLDNVAKGTNRPLLAEIPLGAFSEDGDNDA